MRRISLTLLLFVLACIGREIVDYFDARYAAYRAYQDQATQLVRARRHEPPFASMNGHIVDVMYILESVQRDRNDVVRLVAVQSVHFQRGLAVGNWGGRRIARTRHRVLMRRYRGQWVISELQEELTELTSLGGAVAVE